MDHRSLGMFASQLTILQLFRFFYVVRFWERGHITLTSLKVMTSAVVTDLYREIIIHTSMKFQYWIEVVMEPLGFLSNKCLYCMHINYSWNLHQNIFTLTISFIVLNAAIEFVLIYRPHPVYIFFSSNKTHCRISTVYRYPNCHAQNDSFLRQKLKTRTVFKNGLGR